MAARNNCYGFLKDGTTKLHEIIKTGTPLHLKEILEAYEGDLNKIKFHIERHLNYHSNDKIWLKKIILIAATEQQCREAKTLENESLLKWNIEEAIFVLLLYPLDKHNVAVIHPCDESYTSAFRFIKTLIPNGFLNLNHTGRDEKCETFIETAAFCGNTAAIARLLDLGAFLSLPGHNPLLHACKNTQKATIRWLLTEQFDNFDCTLRCNSQLNAFMILMKKNDEEILDYVLLKMITYRQKYFNESESQAFNNIFRYEHKVYTRSSILSSILSEPICEKLVKYIKKYQLDLSYQWKGITILVDLLYKRLALDYCWDGIRKNPALLGLKVRQDITIVHECIRLGMLEILKEMYQLHPTVKQYFETNQAYEILQQALWNEEYDSSEFILQHHRQFFYDNFERLKKDVIFCSFHGKTFFIKNQLQLIKYFPSLESDISQILLKEPTFYPGQDLKLAFNDIHLINLQRLVSESDKNSLRGIKGSNGATLLHYVVEKDDPILFTNLLDAGCEFDAIDNEGHHPIHYVRSVEMFNSITEIHPEGRSLVHRINFAGYTVLHKICQLNSIPAESQMALIEKVISCGANVNQLTNDGNSLLFLISSTVVLDILVQHGIKLDVVNKHGQTALERHLMNRNRKMSNALLRLTHQLPSFKYHAHKYLRPLVFSNRVFFAQTYRPFLEENPDTLKTLFDSVYEYSPIDAAKLFNKACCNGAYFVINNFLKFNYNIDYNIRGEDGSTCIVGLLGCAQGIFDNLIKMLLAKSVDLEIRNNTGKNALLTYVSRFTSGDDSGYNTDVVQLLLDCGAKVNSQDTDGNTALHLAFSKGELELVETLLQNGADCRCKNNDGKIPIQMCIQLYRELFYFIR